MTPWTAIFQSFFGLLKPLLGPMLAYFKGRSDAKAKVKAEANEEYLRRVNDSADADIVPIDKDSANRDRA
jgi:hypothetical protein